MKVLFLTNIPSPYRIDFFNELGKNCELTVLFERNDAEDRDNLWFNKKNEHFKAVFLKGKRVGNDSGMSFEVIKYLNKKLYDIIVVGGYATPTGMLAISYLRLKKIPFILNADGGFINKNESAIKRQIKKYFISGAHAWLSTGDETSKYLAYYGANLKQIFTYPFTSLLEKDILDAPVNEEIKKKIREKLGIEEEKVILSIGRFIFEKGFDILLKACAHIPKEYGVYIIGGEPTADYLNLKQDLNLINTHFIEFKTKKDLREYYMASDIFVLPTRADVWGLVINEAMACGLPVITTDKCIAGLELIKNDINGFIVSVNDTNMLSVKINEMFKDDILLEKMGQSSLVQIQEYTIENMVKKHIEIFQTIL